MLQCLAGGSCLSSASYLVDVWKAVFGKPVGFGHTISDLGSITNCMASTNWLPSGPKNSFVTSFLVYRLTELHFTFCVFPGLQAATKPDTPQGGAEQYRGAPTQGTQLVTQEVSE